MTTAALAYLGSVPDGTRSRAEEVMHAAEAAGYTIHHLWGVGASAEHATGRAVDFMVYIRNEKGAATGIDAKAGQFIRDYLWTHRVRLGVRHIIWEQHITSTAVDPGVVRAMADRGSPTENHMDHVHVLFNDVPYIAPNRAAAEPSVAPAKKAAAKKAASSSAHRAPAYPGLAQRGSKGPRVTRVQQRLHDRHWRIVVDGDFGKDTETVVRAFQDEKGLTVDGKVGPETWAALWTAPIT